MSPEQQQAMEHEFQSVVALLPHGLTWYIQLLDREKCYVAAQKNGRMARVIFAEAKRIELVYPYEGHA